MVENEKQNSFLDKRSNDEITSIPEQESQELKKVLISCSVSKQFN